MDSNIYLAMLRDAEILSIFLKLEIVLNKSNELK